MTKEEIRHLSIDKLEIGPRDIVYDIGAGTGSVALEMAKKACESTVYAVEQKEEAFDLIEKNKEKLGIYNVKSFLAKAPKAIEDWPLADRVFIGGSGKNMASIIEAIIKKAKDRLKDLENRPETSGIWDHEIKFVINTISLESLAECLKILDKSFEDVEYVLVNSARSKKIGDYNMMMANNPIYIVSAVYRIKSANVTGEKNEI